jgi:hypothetical protein
MTVFKKSIHFISVTTLIFLCGCDCGEKYDFDETADKELAAVASSRLQWTGVAVSKGGRIFTSFPNRGSLHGVSVAEITDTTSFKSYPDELWNAWEGSAPESRLISVQSVFVDNMDFLWILDGANPERNGKFTGVVEGGAKLLQVDLAVNRVVNIIRFNAPAITPSSVLSDVRIDESRRVAYIADSNEGALLIVDLESGQARRVLENDRSTRSENVSVMIDGSVPTNEEKSSAAAQVKNLALTPDRGWLYWRSSAAYSLYRINTDFLRDETMSPAQLADRTEEIKIKLLPLSDGMIMGPDGTLYVGSMETHAVLGIRNNTFFRVKQNKDLLQWPSSFSIADGYLYALASQPKPADARRMFRLFKFSIPLPKG